LARVSLATTESFYGEIDMLGIMAFTFLALVLFSIVGDLR
jgi:hypothetical protein